MMRAASLLGYVHPIPHVSDRTIVLCTAIPEFSMHMMKFLSFEANALAGPTVDHAASRSIREKEDLIAQRQPASQHTDVDLVVSIGD
jgi:hypothetical protein